MAKLLNDNDDPNEDIYGNNDINNTRMDGYNDDNESKTIYFAESKHNLSSNFNDSATTEMIKSYMKEQNRPWDINGIKSNLNHKIGISQIKKSLKILVDNGTLTTKTFGDQQLWWYHQDLPLKIQTKQNELKQKKIQKNILKQEMNQVESQPNDNELKQKYQELYNTFQTKDQQRLKYSEKNGLLSNDDLLKKYLKFYKYAHEWKKRKQYCYNIISDLFDNQTSIDLIISKTLNCVTDKDCNVSFNDYKSLYKISLKKYHQNIEK